MGILEHDVSDAMVEIAVTNATGGDAELLERLLVGTPDEFRGLVLSKCLNPTNQPTTDAGRIQLAEVLARITNDLPSDDHAPFSDQDQLLTWIGELLVGVDKETPSEVVQAVIWKLDSPPLRIRTWTWLENNIARTYRSKKPSWYDEVTTRLVNHCAAAFLDHLKQGDDAATRSGIGYEVHFVMRHRPDLLRTAVHDLLESGGADLPTLASRLVSARTILGTKPNWELSPDFNQEVFNQLAPSGDDPDTTNPFRTLTSAT